MNLYDKSLTLILLKNVRMTCKHIRRIEASAAYSTATVWNRVTIGLNIIHSIVAIILQVFKLETVTNYTTAKYEIIFNWIAPFT
jgi:hypothetical protein